MSDKITFELDGKPVEADTGETIWQVAQRHGTKIPHLCWHPAPGYRADGNCRACMVEVEGERVLAASCQRSAAAGMKVKTATERAKKSREMVFELLMADQPTRDTSHDPKSAFWNWIDAMGVTPTSRFPRDDRPVADVTHSAIAVNLDACINCGLCVRACREVQANDVIGMAYRGHGSKVVFDFDQGMGNSTCVACGECVQVCPTGALMEKSLLDVAGKRVNFETKSVDTLCPYCGVGCQTTAHVKDNKILYVDGRDGPANNNRLCVKGRFGFDYIHHPDRLTKPLIRRDGVPKDANMQIRRDEVDKYFREATWEEALAKAASALKTIHQRDGGKAIAGFGSAKGSNEEAYLFQKLIRQGFGTNNVDHCTRLCHASSVAALMEGVNSGAVTAPFTAAKDADCIIVIGARPAENHPVAATFLKNAAKRGAKMIVMDPRGQNQGIARYAQPHAAVQARPRRRPAQRHAQHHHRRGHGRYPVRAGAHRGLRGAEGQGEGLHARSDGAGVRHPGGYHPRGRAALRALGALDHLLGHGHLPAHARHRQRALPDRAGAGDRPGRPARAPGLHPLRGQNNVQGASDAGLIPMVFPDYKSVEDPQIRGMYEEFWGVTLPPQEGADGGRDHARDQGRRDQGHVHHGREPGDVRPRRAARPRGACQARASRGAGHLPHRDRLARRRGAAGLRARGEVGHVHQHQPPGADCAAGDRSAGRGASRLGADSAAGPGHRTQLELQARVGGVHRDGAGDAVARQHHLGAAGARGRRHLSLATRPTNPATRSSFRSRSRPPRAAPRSCRPICCRPTSCPTRPIRWCSPLAACWSTGTPAR